ncbi:DUF2218 domain-containing protein [Demequina sp. B12]|uniref:DUF2218 domain-containing protein n=1 Tax=Demequina sp. B12 TaxID=2992757 RepID=UPI00237C43A8|nr:DUF2218 domain-containing protein [Demequina sp. B12]MDE0571870.1 DUF2218 domain-containing protein [Demequina sp. B12]
MTLSITGRARTDRPGRYLKQLCSHLAEKLPVEWDEAGGTVTFETATSTLTAVDGSLEIAITGAETLHVYRSMGIVAGHLEKFGAKAGLSVEWDDAEVEQAYLAKRAEMMAARAREVEQERQEQGNS